MPVPLQCPNCGKRYRLREELAGKRVRCKCGTVLTVPSRAEDPVESSGELQLDDEPPEPAGGGTRAEAASADSATVRPPRRRKRESRSSRRKRIAVGILSIIYGVAMVPFIYFTGPMAQVGIIKLITKLVLAVAIAIGGVLILRRHRSGPPCAGLSCIFLCFFQILFLFGGFLSALATGLWQLALYIPVYLVLVYAIPVVVTIWCLKQEAADEKDSEVLL
jgi:hypothetical protein